MICGDCKKYMECSNAGTVFTECVYEEQYWKSFRAEAAKDIFCVAFDRTIEKGDIEIIREFKELIGECVLIADELIKQLKEKEESK